MAKLRDVPEEENKVNDTDTSEDESGTEEIENGVGRVSVSGADGRSGTGENNNTDAGSEISGIMKDISQHLEFFGYEVDDLGERYGVKHARHWNFMFGPAAEGVLFRGYISTSDDAPAERLLEYCNTLSTQAVVCRFYIDGDGDFTFEAWWPNFYNRRVFCTFLEAWQSDGARIAAHPDSREMLSN
mmetsp:Transcript_11980/g.26130  ORF Transcript_11980/g.26130 Transcript_11980/m.26130 type:complete len:186 (+) Transcript_11980:47-604(+)